MNFEGLFEGFAKYSQTLFITLFSPNFAIIAPTLFLLRLTDSDTIAVHALVFAFLADSLLGIIEAIASKEFDWDKLPRIIYKAIVYFFYLKLSQFAGDLLSEQGLGRGDNIMILFIIVMFVAEGKSAIQKADKLYPNPITTPLTKLFDKISLNTKSEIEEK
jgi:phage-related holin